MHAILFGLLGLGLGTLTARIRIADWLRRLAVIFCAIVALGLVLAVNSVLAERTWPELTSNPLLGGPLFILCLWYCHRRQLNRRVGIAQKTDLIG